MKLLNTKVILYIIGTFLMIEALMLLTCAIASLIYKEDVMPILYGVCITGGIGALLHFLFRKTDKDIGKREGYVIVTSVWFVFSIFGSLPFIFSGEFSSITDAFFETMSGFTTTGASILTDIESVSKGLLLWRSMTQWLGGLGIIVLSLAILPLLGIGGMQLYTAEMTGPTKDKIHPRVKDTAQRLYAIYIMFTGLQVVLLLYGGMNLFDALCHSFSTMSSGGFSPYNASMIEQTPFIQYTVIFFMFIAGVNFTLLYFALHGTFKKVWNNEELRNYIAILVTFTFLIIGAITLHSLQTSSETISVLNLEKTFRDSLFQVVSLVTTTGFVSADYLSWPVLGVMFCFLLMFFGASAGSTSGGIKVVRLLLLAKHSYLEFKRLIHPNAIIPLRLNRTTVSEKITTNVLAYIVIYIVVYVIGVIIISGMGYDLETALGSVVASLGNVGPGIGEVGPMNNYAFLSIPAKWFLSFLMLCGRLELFTVLILFSPAFWKK